MTSKNMVPLGYVELANGLKAIYPMNDIFLNYTFEDVSYWETLRLAVNLLINAYRETKPDASVKPIIGNIRVRTQFRHLLNTDVKTTRDQDIRIIEDDAEATFVEFQNRATTTPLIEIRSVEYFGLGIGHGKGKISNQLWLLAEDVDSVLQGSAFARYILKNETTGHEHPATSGIMYVSLTKLSKEKSPVGELASFLLGLKPNPENEEPKKVAEALYTSFKTFKTDKDVVNVLSLAERYTQEGKYEGRLEGRLEGRQERELEITKDMLKENMPIDMIARFMRLDKSTITRLKTEINNE